MENKITGGYPLLRKINSPGDLKSLPRRDIPALAGEIRAFLIENVTKTGGHLASNLGVVELSVALHRVFDAPRDHIIWDVGHQSYVHKLLTGRRELFPSLRRSGGLCGFTRRSESVYDCFGAGHSSTSLSAALGFAQAERLRGSRNHSIAIIGDGAFTGGMIHEALNNCEGGLKLIIILNENEMSISKNIGLFARNLARLRGKSGYMRTKRATGRFLLRIPLFGNSIYGFFRDFKKTVKNIFYGSNYFEDMGLFYLGPADGNDYAAIEGLLREAAARDEATLIHIKTKKGKGFAPAEKNPSKYHNVHPPRGNPSGTVKSGIAQTAGDESRQAETAGGESHRTETAVDESRQAETAGGESRRTETAVGESRQAKSAQNFSSVMGGELCRIARSDRRVCAITAAMADGTGLADFRAEFPDRFFDVGIAESHALTFAAGLAANRMRPVFAVYSSFLQRGYDDILHDIALQNLPVVICVDRAGFSEGDGATHHGIFDAAFLSHIPGMTVLTPPTGAALRRALAESLTYGGPCAIRYPNADDDSCAEIITAFYPEETGADKADTDKAGGNKAGGNKADADKTNPHAVQPFRAVGMTSPRAVVITYGRIAAEAIAAADILAEDGVGCGIILLEQIAPAAAVAADVAAEITRLPSGVPLVFLEEGIRAGGAGMLLFDELRRGGLRFESRILAVDNNFAECFGDSVKSDTNIYERNAISSSDVIKAVRDLLDPRQNPVLPKK